MHYHASGRTHYIHRNRHDMQTFTQRVHRYGLNWMTIEKERHMLNESDAHTHRRTLNCKNGYKSRVSLAVCVRC